MRVLLVGDASNYHHSLAVGLAALGHDVTVASNGSRWMDTARDIDLSRRPGRLGGLMLWVKLNTLLSGRMRGYDVVHIHNPFFLDLRPQRIRAFFDRLRRDNGAVFLTALGTDPQYVGMCLADDCPLRYNEYRVGDAPTPYALAHGERTAQWLSPQLVDHSRHIYDHVDGAVSALYEYHLSALRHLPPEMVAYGGIPIDTQGIAPTITADGPVRIMVACHAGREAEKGVDRMLPVLRQLEADMPGRVKLDFVQNVPFAQFADTLAKAQIVVDQLYSYTPATTALMAMAQGKVVVGGAEPEYYDFIGEDELRPIVNADPADLDKLYADLRGIVSDPGLMARMSQQARSFVAKHNDAQVVAKRFENLWTRRLNRL